MKFFIFMIVFIFISCSAEKPKVSKAKLTISSKNFATAATGTGAGSETEQGLDIISVVYLINNSTNKQQSVLVTSREEIFEIDFGTWTIVVLDWSEDGGNVKCGKTNKIFNKENDSISISVSYENCKDSFFGSSNYRNSKGALKKLNFLNCLSESSIQNGSCPATDMGGIRSYILFPVFHDYMSISDLPLLINESQSLDYGTDCIVASTTSPLTESDIVVPTGSSNFKMPVIIESFLSNDCSGEKITTYFPFGLTNDSVPNYGKIYPNEIGNNLFIEVKNVFLTGSNIFDTETGELIENAFTLYNFKDSAISNLAISIEEPFSLETTCEQNLDKNSSCHLTVFFNPNGNPGIYEGSLTINYKIGNQTFEQELNMSGSYLPSELVVNDIQTSIFEDMPSTISLYNSPADSCSIISLSNLIATRPCYCNQGGCFVDVISTSNTNGNGEITFDITANELTSFLASAFVSIIDDGVDLTAKNYFYPFSTGNLSISLPYETIDSLNPSSCTIINPSGGIVTTLPTCTCAAGTCTASVWVDAVSSGPEYFNYFITYTDANNAFRNSNHAKVTIISNPFNNFVSIALSALNVNTLTKADNNYLFFGTNTNLSLSPNEGSAISNFPEALFVNSIYFSENLTLFAATNSGIFIQEMDTAPLTKGLNDGLASDIVNHITTDSFGNIFISTPQGLNISRDFADTFETITDQEGLPSIDVRKILPYQNSNVVYAATATGVAISYDSGTNFTPIIALQKNGLKDIEINSDNDIIIAGDNGVHVYLNSQGIVINPITIPSRSIAIDPNNNVIFAGTNTGVYISVDRGRTFSPFGNFTSIVNEVIVDSHGAVYIATDSGVYASYSNVILGGLNDGYNYIDFGIPTANTFETVSIINLGNKDAESILFTVNSVATQLITTPLNNLNCPAVLPAGASCQININWFHNTTLPGVKDGYLRITEGATHFFKVYISGIQPQ